MGEGRYKILKKLAEGGSGETYLVWDIHLEKEWVMKCVQLSHKEGLEVTRQEIMVLKQLRREGIPILVDVIYSENKACLIMEHMQGISLEEKIHRDGRMNEREAVNCAIQIATLLGSLHALSGKLIHGDMKPSNLIWNQGKIALLDFGASVFRYGKRSGEKKGIYYSPGYEAPELHKGNGLSVEADIYALGMVLLYLVTGKIPDVSYRIYPVREQFSDLSEKLEQFILKCTKAMPEERYHTMEEALQALHILAENCKKRGAFRKRWGKRRGRGEKQFKTIQNILLTDGKRFSFVLNCSERDSFL